MLNTSRRARVVALLLAIAFLASGCLIKPGDRPSKLTYKLATAMTVAAGSELPGTGTRYVGQNDKGARVLIKGQEALKRKGDSLDWSGGPVPGANVNLGLRVAWYTDKELSLIGTATVVVEDVNPRAMATLPTSSPIKYSGPIAYGLAKGATIPGSQLVFEGLTADGVKIGGIEGYAYRKTGDSILWDGVLRDRVYIRLDLRVLQADEKSMRVGGLVTLWIGP